MNIRRITISVPAGVARRIKKAAKERSVSAWLTEVIEERLENAELERLWGEFYASVAPDRADTQRANAIFDRLTKPPRGRRAA